MPIQVPQLDDRNFEQLFTEAKARIPVHTPEWTNFNDSDPGITVVQLFAFMTENLLYRSNRIPEANRQKFLSLLGIGLQPASPGRGLVTFQGGPGVLAPLPLNPGLELRAGKTPFITRSALCILPVEARVFYKKPQTDLDEATKLQYQLLYGTLLDKDTDQLQYYKSTPMDLPETGKPVPVVDLERDTIDRSLWVALLGPRNVPVDRVRASIAGQTLALGIYPSPQCDLLSLKPAVVEAHAVTGAETGLVFEIAAPDPNSTSQLPPPTYRRLGVEYAENVLEAPGVVQVNIPQYENERQWLWEFDPEEEGTGDYPPLVEDKDLAKRIATWIRVRLPAASSTTNAQNTASSPGESITSLSSSRDGTSGGSGASGAGNGTASGTGTSTTPRQKALLSWVGVNAARVVQAIPVTNEPLGVANGAPNQVYKVANTPIILETGEDADNFTLQVQNDNQTWETWKRTEDLYSARRDEKVYAIDPESGLVSFGSGLRGMRPIVGARLRVSYEYGGGPAGKVPIGAINKSAALPGGFKVSNPVATWGGDAGETVAEGERNISRYLKHRDRLVAANDFRDITMRTPGVDVGRVETLPLFNPDKSKSSGGVQQWPGAVTVLVIPKNDPNQPDAPVPDRLFLKAVCDWLDPRRLVTTEIYVTGPEYVPVWVSVGITTMPGYLREQVRQDVQAAIREYLSPLTGGPAVDTTVLDDPCSEQTSSSDACPKSRGVGWPLSMEVRRQDLEAVATRVLGVRYVDSIKLGVISPGGSTATDVERVSITGIQLPRLAGISVREGTAEDLPGMMGQQPATDVPPTQVPVPVLPKKC